MNKHDYDISWSGFDTKPHVTDTLSSNHQSKPVQIARSQGLSVVDTRLSETGEYVELPKKTYAYRPDVKPKKKVYEFGQRIHSAIFDREIYIDPKRANEMMEFLNNFFKDS